MRINDHLIVRNKHFNTVKTHNFSISILHQVTEITLSSNIISSIIFSNQYIILK